MKRISKIVIVGLAIEIPIYLLEILGLIQEFGVQSLLLFGLAILIGMLLDMNKTLNNNHSEQIKILRDIKNLLESLYNRLV